MIKIVDQEIKELEEKIASHAVLKKEIDHLNKIWENDARWKGIKRTYSAEQALAFRGTMKVEYTLAQHGAERLWRLLHTEDYISALGALTGNQAVQQVEAGLKAIYLSGWQVAADANLSSEMYPDQSLYPSNSVPAVVRRINNSLKRADQIQVLDGRENGPYWYAPIVADAEAGFGGALNAHELMKQMIEAGAAGVHFEDQLSSAKKCGHMGGKVLVPTNEFIQKLLAARLAADICGTPTLLVARTDADAARFLTSDIDPRDTRFLTGGRTSEGFYNISGGIEMAIDRACSFAPYADLLWFETSHPALDEAKQFADSVHEKFPGKLLAYNCSPSFNWKKNLDKKTLDTFQQELAKMGYKFQFVTLAGFHSLNLGMFELASSFKKEGMGAYSDFQQKEFQHEKDSHYMAITHQKFVGAHYFDRIISAVSEEDSSILAMRGSTEEAQFKKD